MTSGHYVPRGQNPFEFTKKKAAEERKEIDKQAEETKDERLRRLFSLAYEADQEFLARDGRRKANRIAKDIRDDVEDVFCNSN